MIELISIDNSPRPKPPTAEDLLVAAGHLEDLLAAYPLEMNDHRQALLAIASAHLNNIETIALILMGEMGSHHADWGDVPAEIREAAAPRRAHSQFYREG